MADGDDKNNASEDELPDFIESDDDGDEGQDGPEAVADEVEAAELATPEPAKKKKKKKSKAAAPAAAGAKASARSTGGPGDEKPFIVVAPHEEGLFGVTADAPDPVSPPDEERRSRSVIAMILVAIVAVVIVGGGIAIMSSEALSNDLSCFFDGRIEECKTAEKRRLTAQWKDEDVAATNRYGDVTLTYFPADAQVKITQVIFNQEGLQGARIEKERKDIPNKSSELKEGETVERLPLTDLAIFEAAKKEDGSVGTVNGYEYILQFSRKGYKPKELTIREGDWQRVGPGNMIYAWNGLDLEPDIETVKVNMITVMGKIWCLLKLQKMEWDGMSFDAVPEGPFQEILTRNQFKDTDTFYGWYRIVRGQHAEWFAGVWTDTTKLTCE